MTEREEARISSENTQAEIKALNEEKEDLIQSIKKLREIKDNLVSSSKLKKTERLLKKEKQKLITETRKRRTLKSILWALIFFMVSYFVYASLNSDRATFKSSFDLLVNNTLSVFPLFSVVDNGAVGTKLFKHGYKLEHPVVLIPGFVVYFFSLFILI
jgi:hypothetical protein